MAKPDLSVQLFGRTFKTPVWPASGCFGYGREFASVMPLAEIGAICVKGTAPEPWMGNPGTRVTETPGGMLNAIGLQNPGVDHFLDVDWPWLQEQGATAIVNIVGRTVDEYVEVARRLEGSGVAAVELNISCPNVKEGGIAFGTSIEGASKVTAAVRKATSLPLIVKLSPNVTDIVPFAKAVEAEGADGVSLINTLLGMSIDIRRKRPQLGNITGGLSGPAVKPVALRMVWQVAGAVQIPIIGIGGIMTGEDAVEFLMAGASAVQVGTACFVNPRAPLQIAEEIGAFMQEQGYSRVSDMVGAARPQTGATGNLPRLGEEPARKVEPTGYGVPVRTVEPIGKVEPAGKLEPTGKVELGPKVDVALPRATGSPRAAGAPRATGEAADSLRQFLKDSDRA